jgi:hypothetical protein
MIKHNQVGAVNSLLLPLIISVVLGIGFLGFAFWAATGRQDYKNNSDQKVAAAVTIATQQANTAKDKFYAEAAKNPLVTYTSPEDFGSIVVQYPRTWSGYIDNSGSGDAQLSGYFYPGVVPGISNQASVFALHIRVVAQSYTQSVTTLTGLQKNGTLTAQPYALPKLPKQVGVKVSGTLPDGKSGTAVYLPLRDKTLVISTDGSQFLGDFNTYILPNLTFSP